MRLVTGYDVWLSTVGRPDSSLIQSLGVDLSGDQLPMETMRAA